MKTNRIFLSFVALCYAFICQAQFTKNQADDLIINQVLAGQTGTINVFTFPDSLNSPSQILQADSTLIASPFPRSWIYFVDDFPFANWNHPSRYIFINIDNGEDSTIQSTIFPMELDSSFSVLSKVETPEPVESIPNPNAIIHSLPPNPDMYAVIICCDENPRF